MKLWSNLIWSHSDEALATQDLALIGMEGQPLRGLDPPQVMAHLPAKATAGVGVVATTH